MSQPSAPEQPAARGDQTASRRSALIAGARGLVAVSATALLLVVGLWAVARQAPSAGSSLVQAPTPVTITVRNRFRVADYPTARAVIPGSPVARPIGSGVPRREAPATIRSARDAIGQPGRAPGTGGLGEGGRTPSRSLPAAAPTRPER